VSKLQQTQRQQPTQQPPKPPPTQHPPKPPPLPQRMPLLQLGKHKAPFPISR
jgi:hypothetical protein